MTLPVAGEDLGVGPHVFPFLPGPHELRCAILLQFTWFDGLGNFCMSEGGEVVNQFWLEGYEGHCILTHDSS